MAHYFDDVLHRSVGLNKEKFQKPELRRSSTSRSIGARSDFDDSVNEDDDDIMSLRRSSVSQQHDEEREIKRREADAHMHQYISEQLEKVRSHQEHNGHALGDEFETQA
jgi:hypothetical protein